MNRRAEILNDLCLIPSVPMVATKLANLLSDPEVELSRVVEILKYDPALTTRVLRLANSAYFGFSRSVATLKEALVRLGTSRLYRLVIASSFQPILNRPLEGYALNSGELWRHSVAVGIAAENLEIEAGGSEGDLAFTAGLLHDIGKLVIDSHLERDFDSVEEKSNKEELSFESAEKAVLGTDHTEVGSALLEEWSFPAELINVVRWHLDPSRAPEDRHLVDLVHIADMICMMMGIGLGRDGLRYRPSADSLSRLGLGEEAIELTASRTLETLNRILEMFSNNGGD